MYIGLCLIRMDQLCPSTDLNLFLQVLFINIHIEEDFNCTLGS